MRELTFATLLVGLLVAGPAAAETEPKPTAAAKDASTAKGASAAPSDMARARDKLVDLLFSSEIDRIDIRATTFDEATGLIHDTTDKIFEICLPLLGDADSVANHGAAVIEALNASTAQGLALTFSKKKQDLIVQSRRDAEWLGEIVGGTISIIHDQYGAEGISYRDKAANLFGRVRLNPEDSESLLLRHLETVQMVERSSSSEQRRYLN